MTRFYKSILVIVVALIVKLAYDNHFLLDGIKHNERIEENIQALINKPVTLPVRPSNFGTDSNSIYKILFDEKYKQKSVGRLVGAIQIETESYDDSPDPKDDIDAWSKFLVFHDYLRKTFPLVHQHLALEKPNGVSLLYTWRGSDSHLKPLLLTAHQDVVPVDPLAAKQWKYPPYSGHYDGDIIWGRGSIDCKTLLIGELEAIEQLLKDGFKPRRTVLLAFGNDEEIGGKGAAVVNRTLTARYGHNSLYALVDEGAAIERIDDEWYATPGTSEKGFVNVQIALSTKGGHSSGPSKHTSIGIMSKFVYNLENNPFKPILTSKNPFLRTLQEIAKHSKNTLPEYIKTHILRAEFDQASNAKVVEFLQKIEPEPLKYLIQTSQAVDKFHGGVKANALPEHVEVTINHRIAIESNLNETIEHDLHFVKELADEFDLGVYYIDQELRPVTNKGYFNITLSGPIETLPVSPDRGPVWDIFAGTIKHLWEDVIFEDKEEVIHIAPTLLGANTDTKKYYTLTPNIYRFFPTRVRDLGNLGIHSIDEHIPASSHLEIIGFMYEFVLNADAAKDE